MGDVNAVTEAALTLSWNSPGISALELRLWNTPNRTRSLTPCRCSILARTSYVCFAQFLGDFSSSMDITAVVRLYGEIRIPEVLFHFFIDLFPNFPGTGDLLFVLEDSCCWGWSVNCAQQKALFHMPGQKWEECREIGVTTFWAELSLKQTCFNSVAV